MEAGPERHARVERQHDGVAGVDLRPGRSHEERADADGLERGLPCLEPGLLLDLTDAEVADRAEAEGLKVAEGITDPTDADARDPVVDEVRLHHRGRQRVERLFDRDAVVADAPEDLAHRFDRLAMRRDRDLEPADGLGVSACGGRDRRSR